MPKSKQESSVQKAVKKLCQHLEKIPKDMRLFSSVFRSLYSEQAVDENSDAAVNFRKIRDDTRQDAMVYLKCVLPVTTNFIRSIKEYFEYYEALSYEDWCEILPEILEQRRTYEDLAQAVLDMYQNMTTPLNKRKEKAQVVMEDFVRLYTVNYPSEESPSANTAREIASEKQYEINKNAARTVAETLIPALSRFIDGMREVAQFFRIIENELRSFEDEEGMDELKQSHYKVIRNSSRKIKSFCVEFFGTLPDVRTDLEAIPSEDSDQNYVEKWLKKTLADIGSQTTVRVLLGSSSGVEEMEPVDTGRKSNRAKTSKNNQEPTPEDDSVQSKPVLPPKEVKPVPPPKNRRPSPPVNDPVPTLKDKPELPARNRSVSAPQEYETTTAKDKPAIPPREEPELAPANDGVPNSKKKPVPLPRNGPASTPVHDQVPKSKNEHRARLVVISPEPTKKKKTAPLPPRNGEAPTTSVYHVPSSENKQAPSRKSKSASTSSDYAVPAPRNGQAQTTSVFYVSSPENKQAPSRKSKLAATSSDYAVPATRNKKESKNAQKAKPTEYQKLTTKETFV